MAYGTSEITTYGIFKMTYGVIKAWFLFSRFDTRNENLN